MAGEGPTYITSVQRALCLLELVAAAPRPVPVKLLAEQAGLSLGTTYNLSRTLVHEGCLTTESDGLVLGPGYPGLAPRQLGEMRAGVFLAQVRRVLHLVSDQLSVPVWLTRFRHGRSDVVDSLDCEALDVAGIDLRDPRTCVASMVRAPGVVAALAVAPTLYRGSRSTARLSRQLHQHANELSFQLGAEHRKPDQLVHTAGQVASESKGAGSV
jgi:DNA-binding IclR family transcriptional regulator